MLGLESITNAMKNMFDSSLRSPANIIPSIIMVCAMARRPGLSCIISTGNIIQDLASKGIPTGPLPDGTPNKMNILVNSVVREMVRALKEDANIQIAIAPGTISVVSKGSNGGGPFVATGNNINFGRATGCLQ